ncbi:unnamed protein product [Microthlaspi erraticum]|uniref:Uncharacterized protein n=1 Tax=Microthlaspi erraticum TaxID=1685480 RepID=A0A6D2HPC2_9BRAS|nr:unnamed protein product [Microthlaspi erraticum]
MAPMFLCRLRESSPPLDPPDPVKKDGSPLPLFLPSNSSVNPPDPPDPPDYGVRTSILEPPDSITSRQSPRYHYLLLPSNPRFLFQPPPVTTGLILSYGSLLDDKSKNFNLTDPPEGVPSPAQKLLPWSSPSSPILGMDLSSHLTFCGNTTFNDNFSTVFCSK